MRLRSRTGDDAIELVVYDYQFPDAEDPHKRFSWHRVRGNATRQRHHWEFQFPAHSPATRRPACQPGSGTSPNTAIGLTLTSHGRPS